MADDKGQDVNKKEEELSINGGALVVTKSQVKDMDDGEFEHTLTYARQQGTQAGDDEAEELLKWRGRKTKDEDDKDPKDK